MVGGGFTGLWTAYYLKQLDPSLSVVVVERHHVGFGASGRNGGWVVAEFACGLDKYAAMSSHDEAFRLVRELHASVDEIGRVVRAEGIECGFHKGGTIRFARNAAQLERQRQEVAHEHAAGFTNDDFRLFSPDQTRSIAAADGILGGLFFAHTAAVDPGRLVTGLAAACEDAGVTIVERTTVESVGDHVVHTDRGDLRARHVVQATEAYTRDLDGERRRLLPVYSRMIATEPLTAEQWAEIGLDDRPTFADDRYMVIYGQRTEDGRSRSVAVGSRICGGRVSIRNPRCGPTRTPVSTPLCSNSSLNSAASASLTGGVVCSRSRVTGPRSCITTPTVGSLLPVVMSARASPLRTWRAARWLN